MRQAEGLVFKILHRKHKISINKESGEFHSEELLTVKGCSEFISEMSFDKVNGLEHRAKQLCLNIIIFLIDYVQYQFEVIKCNTSSYSQTHTNKKVQSLQVNKAHLLMATSL